MRKGVEVRLRPSNWERLEAVSVSTAHRSMYGAQIVLLSAAGLGTMAIQRHPAKASRRSGVGRRTQGRGVVDRPHEIIRRPAGKPLTAHPAGQSSREGLVRNKAVTFRSACAPTAPNSSEVRRPRAPGANELERRTYVDIGAAPRELGGERPEIGAVFDITAAELTAESPSADRPSDAARVRSGRLLPTPDI
jgi:hypothetical protein